MGPKPRSLPSRQWSCSELGDSNMRMLAVKKEAEKEDELQRQIEEYEAQIQALKEKQAVAAEMDTQPATEDEVKRSKGKSVTTPWTAAKAAPKPKSKAKGETPGETPVKENKRCSKPPPESTPENGDVPSPAQPGRKRVRGKKEDVEDPNGQVKTLKEANEKMRAKLAALQVQLNKKDKVTPTTTPKTRPAPRSSASTTASTSAPPDEQDSDAETDTQPSEAAKRNRLRRLCERKPSGKLNVPEAIHLKWKAGGQERKELEDLLEAADFDKDQFIQRVTKKREKVAKSSARVRRGWYTKETMATVLKWSKSYIANVVKYCEKKGNEHLRKRDKYNKQLWKYYVEYEEGNESMDEEIEREIEEEQVAGGPVKLTQLGKTRRALDLAAAAADDSGASDGEPTVANDPKEEYNNFKKFADSLLAKSGKLTDLITQIEMVVSSKSDDSPERTRANKSIVNLDKAVDILAEHYEMCEGVKAEVAGLASKKALDAETKKELLAKVDSQMKKTNAACTKVTSTEALARNMLKSLKAARSE